MMQGTATVAAARRTAARIAAVYCVAGATWIVTSDLLLGAPGTFKTADIAKGLLFIAVTSLLLMLVLRRALVNAAAARGRSELLARRLRFALAASQGVAWSYEVPTGSDRLEDGRLRVSSDVGELVGMRVRSASDWLAEIHPDDRAAMAEQARAAVFGGGEEFQMQYRARGRDGRYRVLLSRARPDPSRSIWYGLVWDITERQQNLERLALLGTLFENAGEGFVTADTQRVVTACNPAAARMLGMAPELLTGVTLDELLLRSLPGSRRSEIWDAVMHDSHWQGRISLDRADGHRLQLSLRLTTIHGADHALQHYVVLIFDVTDIEQTRQRMRELQDVDALTGLPTAQLFLQRLDERLAHGAGAPRMMHVVICDILGFHAINEAYGRDGGDRVLRWVGEQLAAMAPAPAMLARVAGNSFAAALPMDADGEPVDARIERLRTALRAPLALDGHTHYLDIAFGSSSFPADAANAEELLQHAQTALHDAKQHGRGEHRRYTAQLAYDTQTRLQLVAELREAVAAEALSCYFQPKMRLANGRLAGAEVLLRWHRNGELLLPGRFLSYAEEAGLGIAIGSWVLRTALAQTRRWRDAGLLPPDFRIAVNVAQAQIVDDFTPDVLAALDAAGLLPSMLELEFTESIVDATWDSTRHIVRNLRALGVTIALDDFGTGYSSLARLRQLRVDDIKIDQSFVREIEQDGAAAVASSMVMLAHKLGCTTTAEGIETDDQLERLSALGCDFGQGFLFGKAVSAEEFEARYLRSP